MPAIHHRNGFGTFARGAALGLLAGVAAATARKAAMQALSAAAGTWDEALKLEHRAVLTLFDKVLTTADSEVAKRELLLSKIAHALNKHAAQEENTLYPALKHAGVLQVERLIDEHAEMKTFIYDLRELSSGDPRWILKAREFQQCVNEHVRLEEDEIFPSFAAQLSADENAHITRMMNWEGFKIA
jgi:hemerythrin-like domain-containing protein